MGSVKDQRILERLLVEKDREGLNDGEFAEKLGLSKQQFSDIKKGKRPIGTRIFERIQKRLGLPEEEFFPGRASKDPQRSIGTEKGGRVVEIMLKTLEYQEKIIERQEAEIQELRRRLGTFSHPLNGGVVQEEVS